jgi:hypothetical protein
MFLTELVTLRRDALKAELLVKSNRLFSQQQLHLEMRAIELTAQFNALKGRLKGGRLDEPVDVEYAQKLQLLDELQEENSQLSLIGGAVVDTEALKTKLKAITEQAQLAKDRYFEVCNAVFLRKTADSQPTLVSLQSEVDQLVAENQRLMLRLSGEHTRYARKSGEVHALRTNIRSEPVQQKPETSMSLDLSGETPHASKQGIEDSDVSELMTLKQEIQEACNVFNSKNTRSRPESRLSFIETNVIKGRCSPDFLPKSKTRDTLSPSPFKPFSSPVSRPKSSANRYLPSHTRQAKPKKASKKTVTKKPLSAVKLRVVSKARPL